MTILGSPHVHRHDSRRVESMQDKQQFDKVLESREQELQSVDKDLRQLVGAADYVGAMLPARRRKRSRRRRYRYALRYEGLRI